MVEAEALLGCHLVLGPARSGKSRWAEYLALRSGLAVTYLATGPGASAEDPAWLARVLAHRQRRPPNWSTREVGAALPESLASLSPPGLALVDSLGTWVAAGLELDAVDWQQRCSNLYDCLLALPMPAVLVSEQTGWGVVPPTAIGGLFRDRLGSLEQQLAPLCSGLWLVIAGRALDLRSHSLAVPEI
ncbi:bifunctional adenosylcobinamide kinase/adenosylcobinamide-phosphate guanylyltransferase [Synechococcus sp. CBW1108]|uniref:bifunctional adenosylcobinamide kinase/adenosylcobinamide-phosphate guanylyltransferase n=1 Tax=Synechococcus sp. CBW1108 TaxID=1353147 RepID=UPI0018CF9C1E|nr:bifunctional adenosylcobinamide kinase/adenosylcobinamide-phosphate guanylyltransferase [Synechococcus sp. CBW1108]QPN69603.1 bifunctional adenosylcobinamide kinase/adenosylcobinamide-phosphate guanylyltransferase [Synechococcus sp. CBW1108]